MLVISLFNTVHWFHKDQCKQIILISLPTPQPLLAPQPIALYPNGSVMPIQYTHTKKVDLLPQGNDAVSSFLSRDSPRIVETVILTALKFT